MSWRAVLPHYRSFAYGKILDEIKQIDKPVVLVGLMGAGKTQIGRIVAQTLNWPFLDADEAIEEAAGCPIRDIFDQFGEPKFREIEQRVLDNLLHQKPLILATGGGAFIQDNVRAMIKAQGLSLWLKADLTTLWQRTTNTKHRPLLQTDDRSRVLNDLMLQRYPIYAEADIKVDTDELNRWQTLDRVLAALHEWQTQQTTIKQNI